MSERHPLPADPLNYPARLRYESDAHEETDLVWLEDVADLLDRLTDERAALTAGLPDLVYRVAVAKGTVTLPDGWNWGGDLWCLDPEPPPLSSMHIWKWRATPRQTAYPDPDGKWSFGRDDKIATPQEAIDLIAQSYADTPTPTERPR